MTNNNHHNEMNLLLEKALLAHGIQPEVRDGWVALDDTGPALRGFSHVHSPADASVTVRLDVHVADTHASAC